ncbi:MAG: chemotaxis protein CheR [Candidatus Riflebacteria bacterium HGW-Riflebacteria-2]|jgi:chemotaxis protein methyltransferase CheR|nr:MAG: chemotaxis protein CheR [Candidatus Riflebacteria bacterium HGW-Riflebacteria-2]
MSEHLPAALMAKVSQFIESRMALHFSPDRWNDLEQKLKFAAKEFGFTDHEAFCNWLVDSTMDTGQAEILASHLTVSETYFWREPHVFEALAAKILPELVRARENGEKRLRIWSAGCATGEEPYSLAIAVRRAIPDYKNWNITILATDINPGILKRAAAGVYGEWSFRNSPLWLKEKYFSCTDKHKYEISAEIRKMVTFAYLNLAEDTYPSPINNTNAMDIIFCRNVLMYFTCRRIQQIGESLFQSLVKDGWFMVSASELSLQLFPQFVPVHFPEAIVYRKTDQKPADKSFFQPSAQQVESPSFSFFAKEEIASEREFAPLPLLSELLQAEPEPEPVPVLAKDLVEEMPKSAPADIAGPVRELANQGNLKEALNICEHLILEHKLDPNLYFLQATILQEQNRDLEAIASLKRTLFLDPDFYMGHFALGNLMLHQGKKQIARKHFENALAILAKFHQNDVLLESEGLTAGRLREIVTATMQAGALT